MEKVSILSIASALKGVWDNEIGSSLTITDVDEDRSFKGHYHTLVGKSDKDQQYNVVGFFSENEHSSNSFLISFIVNWGEAHALTTWNGYLKLEGGQKSLSTTWLHTKSTKEVKFWDGLTTGSSVFLPKK